MSRIVTGLIGGAVLIAAAAAIGAVASWGARRIRGVLRPRDGKPLEDWERRELRRIERGGRRTAPEPERSP